MEKTTKRLFLTLAVVIFGVSAILGITIVGLKSVKADTTITVSSVSRTYLGYSTSTGTDYVVTFGGCGTTDLLNGIAINAEITSSNAADTYASLRSKIKLNDSLLSASVNAGSTAYAKFYKAGTDSIRIHCPGTFGYAKFEFLSGLTVGTGSLASDVTFYQNTDATFSTVAPDSRINGVYEFSANRSQTHSLGTTVWRAVVISPTVSSTAAANNGGVFAGILFTGTVGGTNYNRAQMVDTDGNALITGLIRQYSGTAIGYNTNYNTGHYEYVIDLDPGVLQTQSITLTFPAGFDFNGKLSTPIVKEQNFTIGDIGARTDSSSYEWYETSHKHELNLINAKTELINGVSYDVEFNFSGQGYFANAVSSTDTDIYFTYNSVNETRTGSTGAGQVYGFVKGRSFGTNTLNNGSFSIAKNASNATFTTKGKTNVLHYSKNLAEYYRNGVDSKYHAVMVGNSTLVMSGYSAISQYSSFALADDNGAGYFGVEWVAGTYTATLTDFKSFDTSGKDLGIYFSNNCTSSTITRYGDAGKTITIKPDEASECKIFSGWAVKDVDENDYLLTITNNGDGTYSFVMPDEDIVVEAVYANAHTAADPVEENTVNPTCTEKGSYDSVVYCSVCGAELSREHTEIDALGHTAAEPVEENKVDATCTEKGSYDSVVYCSVCNAELSREYTEIEASGHTPSNGKRENRKNPTCTEKGSYDFVVYCSVCNAELSREYKEIAALGHRASSAVEENKVDATCTEKGSYDSVIYCSVCNAELSREYKEIAALGHRASSAVEENKVDATCTEKGSYDSVIYCSVCNTELSREHKEIAAKGHELGEEIAEVPATEMSTGTKAHTDCSVCGKHFDADGNEIEDLTIAKLEPAQKGCNSSIGGAEIILIVFVVICVMAITIVKRKKS